MLRYEYKYFVPNNKIALLRKLIEPYTVLDDFADSRPEKEYTVRSIYFDTPSFESYHTKIEGEKHRNKIRIRGYNKGKGKSTVFLEIKKKYEAPILKHRAPMRFKDAKRLFKGGNPETLVAKNKKFENAIDDAKRFMYHVYARKMLPVVTVIYEREPYLSKFADDENNLRITFDKNLRACPYPRLKELYKEKRMLHVAKDYFIVEVKFNKAFPIWMKPIIEMLQLVKEPASKYCMSIDAHSTIDVHRKYQTYSYGSIL